MSINLDLAFLNQCNRPFFTTSAKWKGAAETMTVWGGGTLIASQCEARNGSIAPILYSGFSIVPKCEVGAI